MNLLGKNYYEILGVDEKASTEEIKKEWKKLMLRFHPDRNNNSELATLITQDLNNIRDTLTHYLGRIMYDKSLVKEEASAYKPLAQCIECGIELNESWKTYCSFHYREKMNERRNY